MKTTVRRVLRVVVMSVLLLCPLQPVLLADVSSTVHNIRESTGLFTFDVYIQSGDLNAYTISKVEFAMPTRPDWNLWTASGPHWLADPGVSLDWDVNIAPLPGPSPSWYHNLPLTAVTWTPRESFLMKPSQGWLQFELHTAPWGLPTEWSVMRIWGNGDELLGWWDVGPLSSVPEPSSLLALAGGLGSLAALRGRRRWRRSL